MLAVLGQIPGVLAAPAMIYAGFRIVENPRETVYRDQENEPFRVEALSYDDESDVPFREVVAAWTFGAVGVLVGVYFLVRAAVDAFLGPVTATPVDPAPPPAPALDVVVALV